MYEKTAPRGISSRDLQPSTRPVSEPTPGGNGASGTVPPRPAVPRRPRARPARPGVVEKAEARRRPNLLILGASGHVAQAFLLRLSRQRADFGRLLLLDQSAEVLANAHLDHERLDYRFLHRPLSFPEDQVYYRELLRRHQVDLVLDLTDQDTLPILRATDAAGVSYVNTALNDAHCGVAGMLERVQRTAEFTRRAPHILSAGMNPGIVNIWVWHGYRHYGTPARIVHFEYDTSTPATGWRPVITWSRKEFLAETVWEPTGAVVEGELELLASPAIAHRESLKPILEPVLRLPSYPRGFLVLHEENLILGRQLVTSSKYLYAIHPRTMDYLEAVWRERGTVAIDDLEIADNATVPLTGADTIGVCLDYPERRVYYLHSLANPRVRGANATCAQVAVGVEAALHTIRSDPLEPQIHFASDLYDTAYSQYVFQHLDVAQIVFEKQDAALALKRRTARIGTPAGIPEAELAV